MIGLLFKTHLASAKRDTLHRFQYGEHPDFNERIDNDFDPIVVLGTTILASEALYRTDFKAYRMHLVQFKEEQKVKSEDP